MREFGQAYSYRPAHKDMVRQRAERDINHMLQQMRESCLELHISRAEIVDGPDVDFLRRYKTLGWRIEAASPTFEFAYRYLQKHPQPETLWQHAKRSWKAWWGRQRGRL